MDDNGIIQFDSAILQAGNVSVAEAVEVEGEVIFNETYVVVGEKLAADSIHATYDLTVIGDVEADVIEVNGEFIVNGNIKASKVRSRRLVCTGKVTVENLLCDEDSFFRSVAANTVQAQGSLVVLDSLVVDEKCEVEKNVITGEGLSGAGELSAESVISAEYFDFDGEINANIFEIDTLFKKEKTSTVSSKDDMPLFDKFDGILTKYLDELVVNDEDEITDSLAEMSELQRVSFAEMYYLFSEIVRISKLDEIVNLRDYLITQYAYAMFPIKLIEYKPIEKVFSSMVNNLDPDTLNYSAGNLYEYAFSLRILVSLYSDEYDKFADQIFEFIGLRYSFVNKQFERR